MATIEIKAADVQVGDVVHITAGVAGRVDRVIGVTEKTIAYDFTYTRCDPYPISVGTSRSNTHLHRTMIEVDRPAQG
ncbi:MAG: hypothetical protein PHQ28_00115 [Mycobacterium sp.]|nr:hypothetical protein [Mycobacterium sp.]